MNIKRLQTAVYWEPSGNNEFGETTFSAPIELLVRWQDTQEKFVTQQGDETISSAIVYPARALTPRGYLYLGALSNLTTQQKADPRLSTAKEIRSVGASPSITNRFTVYKIWL